MIIKFSEHIFPKIKLLWKFLEIQCLNYQAIILFFNNINYINRMDKSFSQTAPTYFFSSPLSQVSNFRGHKFWSKTTPNEIVVSRPYFLSFRCGWAGHYHYPLLWISFSFHKSLYNLSQFNVFFHQWNGDIMSNIYKIMV